MSLLYRAKIHENECVEDYVDRIGYHNGFGSRKKFVDWLLNRYTDQYGELGWYSDGDEWNTHHASWYKCVFALEALLRRSVYPVAFLSKGGIYNSIPYCCAVCWAECQYIRGYWHLEEYESCHIHGESLKEIEIYGSKWLARGKKAASGTGLEIEQAVYKAVQLYGECKNSLDRILVERYKCQFEAETISWVCSFFRSRLNKEMNEEAALNECLSGDLMPLSLNERMKRYFVLLCRSRGRRASLLSAVVALRIINCKAKSYRNYCVSAVEEYRDWAISEIYSDEHLLFACIKVKAEVVASGKLRPSNKYVLSVKNELPYASSVDGDTNAYLGKLIAESKLPDVYNDEWRCEHVTDYMRYVMDNLDYEIEYREFLTGSGFQALVSSNQG